MISKNTLFSVFIFTFPGLLPGAEVILSNGDILSGRIVGHKKGQIIFEHEILGRLILDESQIQPKDTPKEDNGLLATGFLENWDRSLELGLNGSEGNSRNQHLHAGARLKFKDESKRWDIETAYDSSENSGRQSRNQFFAQFNRDFLTPDSPRFYFSEGRYDWDQFEDWDYRLSFGGGIGTSLIKKEHWEMNGRLGIGFSKEFGSEDERWSPEGILGLESNWKIAEQHSLEFKTTFYPDLNDGGDFRNSSALNWKIGLKHLKGIDFKAGLKNEFDSNPTGDARKNDFKYLLSLVFGI